MTSGATTPGWERAVRDADHVVELPGGVPMPFRRIPAGRFLMGARGVSGDEEPRHLVELTCEYYLGTFPVTQREFVVWTRATGVEHENHFPGRDLNPAENLDWHQAFAFCEWLTASGLLPPGWRAGLPTEALWEYACRAGSTTEFWSGDGEAALAEVGWFGDEGGNGSTHPVGEKPANDFGLHDVHGNVWEWCLDAWDASAYRRRVDGVRNPLVGDPAESDPVRVVRGGSWFGWAGRCRSAFRLGWGPAFRIGLQGFRVCLLPGPVASVSQRKHEGAEARGGGREGGVEPDDQPPEGAGAVGAGDEWDELTGPPPGGPERE